MSTEILGTNLDMVHYPRLGQIKVEHPGQDDEVQLARIVLKIVNEVSNDVADEVCGAIAFPVGDNTIAPSILWYF